MNVPTFTLVHRKPVKQKATLERLSALQRELPGMVETLTAFRPKHQKLGRALVATLGASILTQDTAEEAAPGQLRAVRTELLRQASVTTVGIWDLGSRVARLPTLVQNLNVVQPTFVFFEIQAGIPAGLVSEPQLVAAWAKQKLGRALHRSERKDILRNIIFEDIIPRADSVRTDLGLDYICGLTPSMVAGEEDETIYWNHISTFAAKVLLVSTQDFRLFASKAERPFEQLIGCAVVAQLLGAMFSRRGLEFHDDRGCLFDYNADRVSFSEVARKPWIEPDCLNYLPRGVRDSVKQLVIALDEMRSI